MGKIKLSAADLYTGTIEAARFPSTLPAVSGASLTSLNASNLSSGTVGASLLPLATAETRGALIVGSNLSVTSGVLSLTSGNVTGALGFTPVDAASKGAAYGVATLGSDGKIPSSQLSAIAITDTSVVASQAAMLALTAQTGDVAVRTDLNKSFILKGTDPTELTDWQELLTPTDAVQSVNGQTGTVSLSTSNISEGTNLYWTTDRFDTRLGSANLNASNLYSGTVPLARLSGITNTEIASDAAIGWSKLSKSGSSLADLATRSAGDLSSGTLPDAVFPATLPAASGVNLTALNASNLSSGTVPLARLSGISNTEIASNAAVAWSKLDKTGSSLADLGTRSAGDLSSGTLPDARFPATLPAASGVNLTSLNAGNLASGTVPLARLSGISNTEIDASAAIAWTKISKSGSSLADLATRSASDLTSGTLPLARLSGITNSELASDAGIVDTKLATISTAGKVSNSATTAASTNTASAIVARDGSGNFSAGVITLGGDPTSNLHAATKQYVDNAVGSVSTAALEESISTAIGDLGQEVLDRIDADTNLGTRIDGRSFAQLVVLGDLNAHASAGGTHDFFMNTEGARTLRKIIVSCPATAASGSIVVDIKLISTQGGSATSMFPTKTKPTITCADGAAWATLTGSSLDTTAIPDNSMVVVTITSATAGCTDLRVELFE